ncbi:MAG TPA: bifunctional polysaccharide deacetylase/glycosyltransferase family 2 protein, partial [Pilimelia sp.]|nr:bifunctional polysaccharide deacetylase/glycosyltransferase family 2 protein [Pilimelia sp.]
MAPLTKDQQPSDAARTRRAAAARRVAPMPAILLMFTLVLGFSSALAVNAYVANEFVPDHRHEEGSTNAVPRAVRDGGPLVETSRTGTRTYDMPAGMIALTFDDGPDPTWTPKVAEILRRHDVPATFFVLGSEVVKRPGIVRDLVADGHELGVHSFSHPELVGLPQWRRQWEYSQTQLAIAGAAGVTTSLIRFPYSSSPQAIDNEYWPVFQEAGGLGYLNVLTDTDSRDWERKGVDAIVRNATPQGRDGAMVLLHDAGGDRSQTVAALDRYLPEMKRRGFRFVTASDALNAARPAGAGAAFEGNAPASASLRWRGQGMVWLVQIAHRGLSLLMIALLATGVLTILRAILLFAGAAYHTRQRRSRRWSWGPPVTEPVSIVVPAYNEREGIAAAVRSLANGDHPGIEVVVVDDGSTDETADIVRGLGLPNVRLIQVPNAGKSRALNVGVAAASHNIIVMVDGDTVFEPDAVRRLVQPFADSRVGAVAGNVKVGNRRGVVARWQHIEYVIGFNIDRRLYDVLQCMPTVPGAIGAFRRQALAEVGGVSDDTLAEDTDLTIALARAGWRVVYEEGARAWTEAPATLGQLWTQRYRWSYGTMQAMWKHRAAVVERGPSGRFGRIGLPFLALFQVVLPLLAPLIDVLAVYGLFFYDRIETVAAWLGMLALQFLTAVVAFRLDRESLRPIWVLPLQQFVYRQMMYLVIIRSVLTALTGVRLRWQKLRRTGDVSLGHAGLAAAAPLGTAPPAAAAIVAAPIVAAPIVAAP